MSSLVDSLFGGTDDSAQKNQIRANERTQQFIEEQAGLARDDVMRLIPQAGQAAQQGYGAAIDLMQGIAPRQIGAVRGGNIRAQETLLAGMPQVQAALLGGPVDNSALQVARLGPDSANVIRNMQQPQGVDFAAMGQQQPAQQQMTREQLMAMLLSGQNMGGM